MKEIIFCIAKIPLNRKFEINETRKRRKNTWSEEEDQIVLDKVEKYGLNSWNKIADEINSSLYMKRTGKQIRQRFRSHLKYGTNKDPWTVEEEKTLFEKHSIFGNKWTKISYYLPGRTDHNIKNYFYSKFRKYLRKIVKVIQKENIFQECLDKPNVYLNPDKVYKLIRKQNISLSTINKETIISIIKCNKEILISSNNTDNSLTPNHKNKKENFSLTITDSSIGINNYMGEFEMLDLSTLELLSKFINRESISSSNNNYIN